MGETPTVAERLAPSTSVTPGTDRTGPIDTTGLDGHTTITSAPARASQHARGRPSGSGAVEADRPT